VSVSFSLYVAGRYSRFFRIPIRLGKSLHEVILIFGTLWLYRSHILRFASL
jgi:hypothetical protein